MKPRVMSTFAAVAVGLALLAACSSGDGGEEIDVQQWASDYNAGAAKITTAHFVTAQSTHLYGDPVESEGEGDLDMTDPSNTKVALDMTLAGIAVQMVSVDGKVYLNLGGTWSEQDPDAMSFNDMDPGFSDAQVAAIRKVVYRGDEDLAGTLTHRYTVTRDAQEVGASLGLAIDGDTVDYEIWVDDDWRRVKFTVSYTVDGEETSQTVT
ncbi:MAG: LppX_LprAFG lipoprotein, partial [Propionibacteriaceae bacterium]|nr:LppX_LprAFG lipoprotein [Propionibacteriaceae bacterium]